MSKKDNNIYKIKLFGRDYEMKVGERVDVQLPIKMKVVDKENFRLHMIASTQTPDRHGDTVIQSGVQIDNFLDNPVILNSHNYGDVTEVIARGENVETKGKGEKSRLEMDWVFAVNENPKAKITFDLYAGKFLNASSIGFIPLEFKKEKDGTVDWFTITKWELLEVSAVSVPANARALAKRKGINVDEYEDDEEEEKTILKKKVFNSETEEEYCCECGVLLTKENYKEFPIAVNIVECVCTDCFEKLTKEIDEEEEEEAPEEEIEAKEEEGDDHVLTEEDIKENPELTDAGLKVGDTVKLPLKKEEEEEIDNPEKAKEDALNDIKEEEVKDEEKVETCPIEGCEVEKQVKEKLDTMLKLVRDTGEILKAETLQEGVRAGVNRLLNKAIREQVRIIKNNK